MNPDHVSPRPGNRRRRLRWKRLLLVTVFFAGFLFGGFKLCQAIHYVFFTSLAADSVTWPSGTKAAPDDGRLNLLVLGLDDPGEGGTTRRSDSMLLASFDRPNKNVMVLSIPRDTLVLIPRQNARDKINHAYAYGGAALAR